MVKVILDEIANEDIAEDLERILNDAIYSKVEIKINGKNGHKPKIYSLLLDSLKTPQLTYSKTVISRNGKKKNGKRILPPSFKVINLSYDRKTVRVRGFETSFRKPIEIHKDYIKKRYGLKTKLMEYIPTPAPEEKITWERIFKNFHNTLPDGKEAIELGFDIPIKGAQKMIYGLKINKLGYTPTPKIPINKLRDGVGAIRLNYDKPIRWYSVRGYDQLKGSFYNTRRWMFNNKKLVSAGIIGAIIGTGVGIAFNFFINNYRNDQLYTIQQRSMGKEKGLSAQYKMIKEKNTKIWQLNFENKNYRLSTEYACNHSDAFRDSEEKIKDINKKLKNRYTGSRTELRRLKAHLIANADNHARTSARFLNKTCYQLRPYLHERNRP